MAEIRTPDREGFVVIYHPVLEATGEVHESALGVHRDSGWQLWTEDGPVDVDPDPRPADPGYDPGQHTVAEVVEYLATLTPEGRDAVLEAERLGKNRAGVRESTAAGPAPDNQQEES